MLTNHLRVAGTIILLLLLAYPIYPIWFDWPAELQQVSLLTRQVFWVHIGFICLLLALQGILLVGWPRLLAAPSSAGVALSIGMTGFWSYRLFAQLVLYSPELWQGKPLHLAVHVIFSLLWLYLTAICAWTLVRQMRNPARMPSTTP